MLKCYYDIWYELWMCERFYVEDMSKGLMCPILRGLYVWMEDGGDWVCKHSNSSVFCR